MKRNVLAGIGLLCALAGRSLAEDFPQIEISNGQIRAVIYLPDAKDGYYRGTRFDWSGVIASLEYKGHNYFAPWYQKTDMKVHDFAFDGDNVVTNPVSATSGPVQEFSNGAKILGYDEAKPGETFLKIGVGTLRKPDEPRYDHSNHYELVDSGEWNIRTAPDYIQFTQELTGPNGYAYRYTKIIRLAPGKPQMVIEHNLKNTGKRAIETDVYDHNFLVLDKRQTGPDFEISFPFDIKSTRPPKPELAEIRGNRIVYLKNLQSEDVASTQIQGFGDTAKDYDIRFENRKAGAGMRVTSDRPMERAMLWSVRSVIAVEPYINISIRPGGEQSWTYTYDFYTPEPAK